MHRGFRAMGLTRESRPPGHQPVMAESGHQGGEFHPTATSYVEAGPNSGGQSYGDGPNAGKGGRWSKALGERLTAA